MEFESDEELLDGGNAFEQRILEGLNDSQKEVVSAPPSNMLIIAGAGTGKTRVLVSRVAWLLNVCHVHPRSILAVTFTNKAAREMRERIGQIVGEGARMLWASTFHSVCLKLLYAYAQYAGLKPGFTVLDTDNQKSLVKRIMQDLNYDIKECKPSEVVSVISKLKEKGIRARDLNPSLGISSSPNYKIYKNVYPVYERVCNQENSVDFSELLLRTVELLENNPQVRALQHQRFKEILIDEFQDTNSIQFKFVRLMAGEDAHVLVVGDDDQSIYGWRGADYTNMKRFLKEYANVTQHLLSLNYRSSQKILDMANTLINDNSDRLMEKELKGNCGDGESVEIINCSSSAAESDFVASTIAKLHQEGERYCDMAILYRNNYLSLAFEQRLTRSTIPFVIYGGQKFFERAEILDALAYLRILVNEDDDTAVLRVINVPARKIGPKVISDLRAISKERSCSIMKAIRLLCHYSKTDGADKALKTLYKKAEPFYALIEELKSMRDDFDLSAFTDQMLMKTGLYEFYQAKDAKEGKSGDDKSRFANLGVLVSNVKDFVDSLSKIEAENTSLDPENTKDEDPLLTYLSNITLTASTELNEEGSEDTAAGFDAVNMMTMHSSKGLEFKYVFLVGFESGILPSQRAVTMSDGGHSLEEERRLAYVGITRAKRGLYISYAQMRSIFGSMQKSGCSEFLRAVVRNYTSSKQRPYIITKR